LATIATAATAASAAAFLAELEAAATRRYGAGWLNRASVAGAVAATTGATAVGSAAVLGAGAAVPATGQAVAYGSAAGTGVRAGSRILGLPQAAVLIAATVVIAAVAAAAVLLTNSRLAVPVNAAAERAQSAVASGSGVLEAGAGSSPSTTTTTPEPVPSLDGTYQVTITLTSKTGDVTAWPEVGAVETESWEVTGTCSSGLCGATVTSSTDGGFTLTYAGESWTQDTSYVAECVDTVTRVPTGDKVDVFGSRTLSATGPTSADPVTSLTSLTGTESLSVPEPGCGSGGVEVRYSIAMTRTGD